MSKEQYHSASHCKYLTQYHFIWCPTIRYAILGEGTDNTLKQILTDICTEYGYNIKALEVMPDHVHIFIDCPQTAAPSDIARTLKSNSAIRMLQTYPQLKQFYSHYGVLWSRGYFVSTIEHISEETIRKYIQEQKNAT